MAAIDLLPGFDDARIAVDSVHLRVRTRRTPAKPPLLLLHGHPQTHAVWQKVASALAEHFSIVCPTCAATATRTSPKVATNTRNSASAGSRSTAWS